MTHWGEFKNCLKTIPSGDSRHIFVVSILLLSIHNFENGGWVTSAGKVTAYDIKDWGLTPG
jgi:hypothetical protein